MAASLRVPGAAPLLDLRSYARSGPGRRDRLSHADLELITRTVRRAPEVMVKVLTRGAHDVKGVARHMAYLNRHGDLELETDDGESYRGKGSERALLREWDLEIDEIRRTTDLKARPAQRHPKLVHKVLFSMPPGTSPQRVLKAVKNFAREEFAFKHRYAMVLHTDEPHPHVHLVVKSIAEDGQRLNIRKVTLRAWRQQFANELRRLGVEANATDRAARGSNRIQKLDGIYRAELRGQSTHMTLRRSAAAGALTRGSSQPDRGAERLTKTRQEITRSWADIAQRLAAEGHEGLSEEVRRFSETIPPPVSEQQQIAPATLQEHRAKGGRERTR